VYYIGHGSVIEPDQAHVAQALTADDNEVARLAERHDSSFRVLSESIMLKRILVADDSDTVRRVLRSYLTQQAFDVCGEAADGEDAIEQARKLKPDLILLDAAMPRTNGIVAASVLKEMMPNVRIVLFTMYSEAIARAFPDKGLAVDAVVAKAEGMSRLADRVQDLLRS
jgi:DNA-binding NarL/FixJ family response regulator